MSPGTWVHTGLRAYGTNSTGPYGTLRDLTGSRAHGTGPYGQLTGSLRDAYGTLTGRLRDLTGSLRELTGSVRELTGLRAYEGLTGFGVACESVCWTVQAPFQAVQGLARRHRPPPEGRRVGAGRRRLHVRELPRCPGAGGGLDPV